MLQSVPRVRVHVSPSGSAPAPSTMLSTSDYLSAFTHVPFMQVSPTYLKQKPLFVGDSNNNFVPYVSPTDCRLGAGDRLILSHQRPLEPKNPQQISPNTVHGGSTKLSPISRVLGEIHPCMSRPADIIGNTYLPRRDSTYGSSTNLSTITDIYHSGGFTPVCSLDYASENHHFERGLCRDTPSSYPTSGQKTHLRSKTYPIRSPYLSEDVESSFENRLPAWPTNNMEHLWDCCDWSDEPIDFSHLRASLCSGDEDSSDGHSSVGESLPSSRSPSPNLLDTHSSLNTPAPFQIGERATKNKAKGKAPKRLQRTNKPLESKAITVMLDWYDSHSDDPYPTTQEKQELAKAGNISVAQVNSWFANKRNRSDNTRSKKQKRSLQAKVNMLCSMIKGQDEGASKSDLIHNLGSLIEDTLVKPKSQICRLSD